jgi:hypothetical protein
MTATLRIRQRSGVPSDLYLVHFDTPGSPGPPPVAPATDRVPPELQEIARGAQQLPLTGTDPLTVPHNPGPHRVPHAVCRVSLWHPTS